MFIDHHKQQLIY